MVEERIHLVLEVCFLPSACGSEGPQQHLLSVMRVMPPPKAAGSGAHFHTAEPAPLCLLRVYRDTPTSCAPSSKGRVLCPPSLSSKVLIFLIQISSLCPQSPMGDRTLTIATFFWTPPLSTLASTKKGYLRQVLTNVLVDFRSGRSLEVRAWLSLVGVCGQHGLSTQSTVCLEWGKGQQW